MIKNTIIQINNFNNFNENHINQQKKLWSVNKQEKNAKTKKKMILTQKPKIKLSNHQSNTNDQQQISISILFTRTMIRVSNSPNAK